MTRLHTLPLSPALIVCDLDHTLLLSDGSLAPETCATFQRLQDLGIRIVLASGRPHWLVVPIAKQMRLHGFIIANNGAVIYDLDRLQVVERSIIPIDQLLTMIARLREIVPDLAFSIDAGSCVYAEQAFCHRCPQLEKSEPTLQKVSDVVDFLSLRPGTEGVSKWFVLSSVLSPEEVSDILNCAFPGITCTHSGDPYVQATVAGVTKASALAKICAFYQIPSREVIVFGDNFNDIPMFLWQDCYSVAVSNAHPLVRRMAREITTSNDEQGVAAFLNLWFPESLCFADAGSAPCTPAFSPLSVDSHVPLSKQEGQEEKRDNQRRGLALSVGNSSRLQGVLFMLITALFMGLGTVLNKMIANTFDPFWIAFIDLVNGSLLVALFQIVVKKGTLIPKLTRSQWMHMIGLASIGTACPLVCVTLGLRLVSSADASYLLQLQVLPTIFGSVIFLHEKIRMKQVVGLVLVGTGSFLVLSHGTITLSLFSVHGSPGMIFLLVATLGFAYSYIAARTLATADQFQVCFVQLAIGALVIFPFALCQPHWALGPLSAWSFGILVINTITNFGIAYTTLLLGVKRLKAWEASALMQFNPVFSLFFSSLFLHSMFSLVEICGSALAFSGGFLVARQQKEEMGSCSVIELQPGFFADPPDTCSPSLPAYEAVS